MDITINITLADPETARAFAEGLTAKGNGSIKVNIPLRTVGEDVDVSEPKYRTWPAHLKPPIEYDAYLGARRRDYFEDHETLDKPTFNHLVAKYRTMFLDWYEGIRHDDFDQTDLEELHKKLRMYPGEGGLD